MTRLARTEIAALDPYRFMAVIGKRVIHPGGRASTESLLARADIREGSRVLDVGCGVATTAIEIARRHGAEVSAVDISPLMLERAAANVRAAGVERRVAWARGLPGRRGPDGEPGNHGAGRDRRTSARWHG